MDIQTEPKSDLDSSVETLYALFGDTISKEVILTVLENCEGNLNLAAEIVMSLSNDTVTEEEKSEANVATTSQAQLTATSQTEMDQKSSSDLPTSSQQIIVNAEVEPAPPTPSYANASRSTGAVPKQLAPKPRPITSNTLVWTDQIRQIVAHHGKGSRILIFMRGAPGSGKSHLARQIIELTIGSTYADFKTHICSTDDYFMIRGQYQYEKFRLSEAHEWNQNRVKHALRQGLSPIIVDNTNIEIWEMEPYAREGVKNGYIIELVEPSTPWAKKAFQLVKKSTHNVPPATIQRMLGNLRSGLTGADLIRLNGLSYPADMVPPVIRNMPVYIPAQTSVPTDTLNASSNDPNMPKQQLPEKTDTTQLPDSTFPSKPDEGTVDYPSSSETVTADIMSVEEQVGKQRRYLEIQKQIEEMERVEEEWENGESWEEVQEIDKRCDKNIAAQGPLPPRNETEADTSTANSLLETVQKYDDWSKISMFLPPPWVDDKSSTSPTVPLDTPMRETISSGTCMEIGDADINNKNNIFKKIVTTSPRDINVHHIPSLEKEKIPQMRMFDKSTSTNEVSLSDTYRCKNEEQHFVAFRKLFKNVPRAALRDVFDKCCGDVNWAVDIVLGGLVNNQLEIADGEESDTEEEVNNQCNCLVAYNVVPNTDVMESEQNQVAPEAVGFMPSTEIFKLHAPQKKQKPQPTESSLQLKREIEKNIVLSENYYSDHLLKIKKWRHGEYLDENSSLNVCTEVPSNEASNASAIESHPGPSTSTDFVTEDQPTKDVATSPSDDEESNTSSVDDVERTVNVNLGADFVFQLDDLFGRKGMAYPENIVPRVNMPVSLLNEINAFWMESLMYQLDEQDKQNTKMLKEDAEFARQLALKEAELAQQGKEPEVPDFKEIMDMDFAISLYQKDVAEWRNKEPNDIAAKLSRDKLYNLFPDISPDILSELLMAHDNNFQATVEVMLMSTGKANILEEKNGLSKFVMEKEMERQEKILEEESKTLTEVEWPLLPKGEKVEMNLVNEYREEADKHLARRNLYYQKAQDYIRRGMTQVANYYSDIASFHKKKYEQANSLAAASLMQVHASNCQDNATIDLHYLRVGEAKESLDLFLDTHIQKLRESANRGVRCHTLFFITGRGLHSNGRPRVKPAVKKRLRERGLVFSERNPGLLTAKVCAEDKLSYQVQAP